MNEMTRSSLDRLGAVWVDRIRAVEKRYEEGWYKEAEAAEAAYLADSESDDVPEFNILHANVETIVPNLLNSQPVPDIRPRHNAEDDLAKLGGDILERVISSMIDDDALNAEVEMTVLDAEISGRGVTRIKYDADEAEGGFVNERVLFENVSWRDYREGDAKRWRDVPWVAFGHFISQEQREEIEDEELAEVYAEEDGRNPEDEEKTVRVWECWDKQNRRIVFVCEEDNRVLSIKDDVLGLDGFFPIVQPVQHITGSGSRTPVCPYSVYRKQAEELDAITKRIKAIIKGLKVRGAIAADADSIEDIAQAGDNELVAVANIENLIAAGGLDKAVMWWPIDTAIAVLRELYLQREQVKQTIYEITGISDLLRGQTAASETATAQELKARSGSLRVKKRQNSIERHIRDLFHLAAELIAKTFSVQGIQQASGLQVPPEVEQLIRSPLMRYRIDVESESTIRADMTDNRREMAEFLNGTGQFFSTMAPVVAQAPQTAVPMVEVYAAFARQFNLGAQAEAALEKFADVAKQTASQPRPNPEAEKMKAEMQMKQMELAMKQEEVGIRKTEAAASMQEAEFRRKEATARALADRTRARTDRMKAEHDMSMKEYEVGERVAMDRQRVDYDVAKQKQDYDYKVEEIAAAAMQAIQPMIGQVMERIDAQGEQQQQEMQTMMQNFVDSMGQIAAAQNAPKQIVRENGRIVGSKSTYDGPADGLAGPVIEALTRERRIDGDMVN